MRVDIGLDTGDMIEQTKVELSPEETGGSLFDRLAVAGAKLCVSTMEKIQAGTAVYTKQSDEEATHTRMISKKMGKINWKASAVEIERLIRGLNPWPSAYTFLDGKTLKIWRAAVLPGGDAVEAGCVVQADDKALHIQTGEGILSLEEVQLEGKKRMKIADFLRGHAIAPGTRLSE